MKHQALICLIAIQAFICTGTLLGVEPVIAGAIDDVAVGHAKTAVYVVDHAADMNPGTEQMPFKTVQSAADAAKPGDTIYVMAGRYDKLFKVKAGGTDLIEGWKREADGSWSATLGCTSLKLSCATKASI